MSPLPGFHISIPEFVLRPDLSEGLLRAS